MFRKHFNRSTAIVILSVYSTFQTAISCTRICYLLDHWRLVADVSYVIIAIVISCSVVTIASSGGVIVTGKSGIICCIISCSSSSRIAIPSLYRLTSLRLRVALPRR